MKKNYLMPLTLGVLAFAFSCTGTGEGTTDTADAENPMEVETADEAEVIGDEADLPVDEDEVVYVDMFNDVEETENYDIMELARMDENLSIFVRLVELSGLDASLAALDLVEEDAKVTVFIPTDKAFKEMPEERYEYLVNPENRTELIKVLQWHILPNEVPLIQFNSSQVIDTEGEHEIPVSTDMAGTVVYVGGAQIVKSDIEASNGIIHVVNDVIEPSEFTEVR